MGVDTNEGYDSECLAISSDPAEHVKMLAATQPEKSDSPSPIVQRDGLGSKARFQIVVFYAHPPIPDRKFDWQAYYDGDEEKGQYGEGSTPYMAIKDLIDNINPTEWWEKNK